MVRDQGDCNRMVSWRVIDRVHRRGEIVAAFDDVETGQRTGNVVIRID